MNSVISFFFLIDLKENEWQLHDKVKEKKKWVLRLCQLKTTGLKSIKGMMADCMLHKMKAVL